VRIEAILAPERRSAWIPGRSGVWGSGHWRRARRQGPCSCARLDRRACPWHDDIVLAKLPGWVKDDATSVRDEVAEWIGTTAAERWRLAVLCSRDAMWAARASGHRDRILEHTEPLPASTERALERLRKASNWGHGQR
jgi:hypothetical protein